MTTKRTDSEYRELAAQLKERNKELSCLHALSCVVEQCKTVEDLIGKALNLLPPAYQFPRDTSCPFCTNDKIFGEYAGKSYVWEFQNEVNKHWYRCADKAIRWHDGRMVRFELASDITAGKDTEQELAEQERQFRLLAETAKDMIYRMSIPEGKYEYVSPASKDLFGYTPEEFYEQPRVIEKIIHPDWHTYFLEQWASLLRGEAPPVYEYQIVHRSGDVRWMNQRNALLRNANGDVTAIQGIVTDVTEARNTAAQLERTTAELKKTNEELDHRIDGQGHAGRPPEVYRGRRQRVSVETDRPGPAAFGVEGVAVSMNAGIEGCRDWGMRGGHVCPSGASWVTSCCLAFSVPFFVKSHWGIARKQDRHADHQYENTRKPRKAPSSIGR